MKKKNMLGKRSDSNILRLQFSVISNGARNGSFSLLSTIRYLIFTIVIIGLVKQQTHAQTFQWAKQFVAPNSVGNNIVIDNNFNIVSSGTFRDSVDLDPGLGTHWVYRSASYSNQTEYLSKVDSNGSLVWGYSYDRTGGPGASRIISIDIDKQNNIIVLGRYVDSIDLDLSTGAFMLYDHGSGTNHQANIFIAKYNSSGGFVWGKRLYSRPTSAASSSGRIYGTVIRTDQNNNIILTGGFRDTVDFNPGSGIYDLVGNTNPILGGIKNKFLLKLDSSGNFIWVRNWHLQGSTNLSSHYVNNELDIDNNNNIFIPINFRDSLDTDPLSPINMIYSQGLIDVSFLKISPNGNLLWHKEIGGNGNELCYSLATDLSGNIFYYIASSGGIIDLNPGTGVYTLNLVGNNNCLLKLDSNGTFLWAFKNIHNYIAPQFLKIATDISGSLYLTTVVPTFAGFNAVDLDPGPGAYIVSSTGLEDIAFQNFDSNGHFIWGGLIGGTDHERANFINTDKAKGVYLTGNFRNIADFNPTPDTSYMSSTHGAFDAFVVKLKNCNKVTSQTYEACDSVFYNNHHYFSDTILQYHYPASNGCDSAHSIVIDVKKKIDTLVVDTCTLYVWNNITYTSSGYYNHTYNIPNDCDSTAVLNLTIRYKTSETINIDLCDSTTINGITYNAPGSYNQILTNTAGCDSILTINIMPLPVDTSIMQAGLTSLISNAVNASYQWIDCNMMQPIFGETNASFNATQSGSYACIVTQNGCSDTSSCYPISLGPNHINNHAIQSRIYPNPSRGSYHLELKKQYDDVRLEVRTIDNRLIWYKSFFLLKETDITLDKPAGVYILYIIQGTYTQEKKLLKW